MIKVSEKVLFLYIKMYKISIYGHNINRAGGYKNRRLYKMDKRKYQTKTLIAEYQDYCMM